MARSIIILVVLLAFFGLSESNLTQSRLQNRHLQRVLNHNRITIILEGVRTRALNTIKPDPILYITFPQINHHFEVRLRVIIEKSSGTTQIKRQWFLN